MIPVKRLSASSITTLDSCEMKWILQYIMGYREPSGKAAAIGTICHYILECVARAKKLRDQGRKYEKDNIVGRLSVDYDIDDLTLKTYEHFIEKESHLEWSDADLREVKRNIEKALKDDMNPENHGEIIQTEHFFHLKVDEIWGEYAYMDGEEIKKDSINLVGVVDLIFRDQSGTLNILDYKFGQPKDWVTNKEKDLAGVIKDVQLCMYYYALRKKYPDEDIIVNLWYVKHNKLFSTVFSDEQEEVLVGKIRSCLNKIRNIRNPKTQYSFKCKFCAFSKTNFADWGRPELDVPYDTLQNKCKFDDKDGKACVCDAVKTFCNYRGIQTTIEKGKANVNK